MHYVMALIFVAVGGGIVLAALGFISASVRTAIPNWPVFSAGILFFSVGLMIAFKGGSNDEGSVSDHTAAGGHLCIAPRERPVALIFEWLGVIAMFAILFPLVGVAFHEMPRSGSGWDGFLESVFYSMAGVPEPEWVGLLVFGIFALFGIAMLIHAITSTLTAIRFGNIPLQLTGGRPHVGGTLAGFLDVPALGQFRKARAELTCYCRSITQEKGRKHSTSEVSPIWRSVGQLQPAQGSADGRLRLDLKFDIPPDLPQTSVDLKWILADDWSRSASLHCWELVVTSDIPGVDLVRTYDIPVEPPKPGTLSAEERAEQERIRKREAALTVAAAELAAGRPAEQVVQKLKALGLQNPDLIDCLESVARDDNVPGAAAVRLHVAELRRMQAEIESGQLMMLQRPQSPGESG